MRSKSSTIRDVARRAGVSTTTVSDIMTGRGGRFLKETTDRVLDVAAELNYRRHSGASAMRSRRFNAVGLILNMPADIERELIAGVDQAVSQLGLGLTLVRIGNEIDDLPDVVTSFQVDGLIADWAISNRLSAAIERYNVPTVWVNNEQHGVDNCVWPDDVASGRLATQHLIELGHRNIGFVYVPQSTHASQTMRLDGYRQALAAIGSPVRAIHCDCPDSPGERHIGPDACRRRYSHPELWQQLAYPPTPTALVCYNTPTAMEVYTAFRRRGVNIEEHFAIIACDEGLDSAEKAVPSLSTVLVDHAEMGRLAVNMLVDRIAQAGRSVASHMLSVCIHARESSVACDALTPMSAETIGKFHSA